MVSFKRLRDLKKVSFARHLITLPYHMMNSASTGIFAGQIAARLAGLATAVVIGTTTALTTTGSLIISIVGGIVGIIAITTGILGLANEHSKNTETLKTIIGSESEPGQDYQLKMEVAKLLSSADQHDQKSLGEILFYLHGIEGENFTEKLCNLFDVEYIRSHDTMGGKYQNPANTPTPQQLLGVKIIELLTTNKTEWRNVPPNLLSNLARAESASSESIKEAKNALKRILNRTENIQGKKTFKYDYERITDFVENISRLPGDNLNAKIACLYGIDPRYSLDLDDLVRKIKETEPHLILEEHIHFENIHHLNRVMRIVAERQYFSILLSRSQGTSRENAELKKKIDQFKKTLSLIEGDDYDMKIDKILGVSDFERSSTKFKERALLNQETKQAIEGDPALLSKLLEAKKEFDYDHSTVFFRPLSYMQDLFYAFSGSLTGFGLVTSIAAFVGVGIATSGAGFIVLIAAIASALLGFTIAYLVQRYTRNYSNSFKKETDATVELTHNATNKTKELNNDLQKRLAVSPRPKPQEKPPTDALLHLPQFQMEKELKKQREEIEQLKQQLNLLQNPVNNTNLEPSTVQQSQHSGSFFPTAKAASESAERQPEQKDTQEYTEPPSNDAKPGEKRPAEKDPSSPPLPSLKQARGENEDSNK